MSTQKDHTASPGANGHSPSINMDATHLGYFPGCSLHATGRELDESLRAVADKLGVSLDEVHDWSCCGSSSAHSTNHLLGVALAARNLSLAEAQGLDRVMAPCAACYARLASARHEATTDAKLATQMGELLGRPFTNRVEVMNLVAWLESLRPRIEAALTRPLTGLKVACYYGCLLVRPVEVTGCADPECPTGMEDVVRSLGATPVDWSMRLDCCGGGFSLSRVGSVVRLGRAILDDAKRAGADVIAVACPMCQSNLDLRQQAMSNASNRSHGSDKADSDSESKPFNLPILYLTELVGLGLGLSPRALGLERHFVSTAALVGQYAPLEIDHKALPAPPNPPATPSSPEAAPGGGN